MRFLLILSMLCAYMYTKAQDPFENKRWSTNTIIGATNFKFDSKIPEIILDTLDSKYPYGYITNFLPDQTFISYNIGPCGNECRMTVKGTYLLTENRIELLADSISYWKECSNRPVEKLNTSLGSYLWQQKGTTIILTRESNKK